ncbi:MAG: SLC13 family permease [Planctomycetota bacterium]|nr:SLC13 family permease [Planctomycetota bacterium]
MKSDRVPWRGVRRERRDGRVTPEIIEVLIVLAITLILFASEFLAVDVIAVLVLLYLVIPWPWSFEGDSLLGIGEALEGFGHPAVIGVGALFIVSEGLLRTGALGFLSNHLHEWSRGSNRLLTAWMLLIVLVASAFLNNTPVVAMFIPVALGACLRSGMNPSSILIPLSYAAILGGTCTLIGTSTNILVASIARESAGIELGMFEFAKLGFILAAIGFVYLLTVAPRLLPERQTITSLASLGGDRRHREYITEIEVRGGDLIGKRFGDSMLATAGKVRILQIIRGEEIIWPPLEDETLQLGDALVISGAIEDLMAVQEEQGVASLSEIVSETQGSATQRESQLAELLVLPSSHYVGQLLGSVELRRRFGLNVIGLQRHGMHMRSKISEHPLRTGDVLLIQGTPEGLDRIRGEEGVVLMSGVDDVVVRKEKAPLAIIVLIAVIGLLATQILPMATVALAGAVAMVVTGCISGMKIYEAVQWKVLVLIAGTLALGQAMVVSKTADWLAQIVANLEPYLGAHGLVVVTLIVAALLTEMVSNAAVAAVLVPVALKIATEVQVSPYPFVMAVAFGASLSFLTPIGYQTNTLVYGAGGYRFGDFARVGAPLVVIIWAVAGLLIPYFWPLTG